MLYIIILLIFLNYNYVTGENLGIVNGTNVEEGEFTFVISLRENSSHVCAGTILNERYILTSPGCFFLERYRKPNLEPYSVQYGSTEISNTDERTVMLEDVCIFPTFDMASSIDDVAVVKLATPLSMDYQWETVILSDEVFSANETYEGVVTVGWGSTTDVYGQNSNQLLQLDVQISPSDDCYLFMYPDYHMCIIARNGTPCTDDNGDPLLYNGKQIGIETTITNLSCPTANTAYPVYYTRIERYIDFIQKAMNESIPWDAKNCLRLE